MDENHLTPEEMKFFETGELQPGMTPQPPEPPAAQLAGPQEPAVPVVVPPQTGTPPVPPDLQQQQVSLEVADMLRRSLQEAQQRAANLEATVQQLQQQVTQPPKQPDPEPDINTDPLGAMMHKLEAVNKVVADLQASLGQQQAQQANVTAFQQFQQQVNTMREQFVKTQPDFPAAYEHVRNARMADLRTFGIPEDRIQQVLFQEEAAVAQQAIRNAKNPAEAIYEMAKRHGYVPKPHTPGTPTSPDNKLASIQQAQAASKNLPSTPHMEDLTVEGLKGASDADLTRLVQDDKMWAKIVGSDQHPI